MRLWTGRLRAAPLDLAIVGCGAVVERLYRRPLEALEARRLGRLVWWGVAGLTAIVTLATFRVQPGVPERLGAHHGGLVFPLLALGGLMAMRSARGRGADRRAFAGSCAFLAGMLASAAFGVYPCLLPAVTDPAYALTVRNAAASEHGLRVGLAWWIPGMALAVCYFTFVYRTFAGKARLEGEGY